MNFLSRYLHRPIAEDLKKKMVFIGGPRQVGKTSLSLSYLDKASTKHPAYFNWDVAQVQIQLKDGKLPPNQILIIFDEIHKYRNWRNLLKSFYDIHKSDISFLVTGSARLDYYRRGGDSLQGRYHYYRLHPLSVMEVDPKNPSRSSIERLMKFGGFPEPFLNSSERDLRRWQVERKQRVVYEDLRDLENVREIGLIELLTDALPSKVGSPLSVKSLREDLNNSSHEAVERWIRILENLYYCYRIPPFGSPKIRAVKKEQKLYLWDWSEIEDPGIRFENLVASQLLKYCHFIEDTQGHRMELRFLRDTDKREVDFVVLKDKKPEFAVEAKLSDTHLNPAIPYFKERTKIPKFFQVHMNDTDYLDARSGTRILPFFKFCEEMQMP